MAEKNFPQTIDGYDRLLKGLKERIRQAQVQAALSVNQGLILLYWQVGRQISE
ncbi:MAG: hypothetical protein K2X29_07890 [Candidatus Obscuribacterales bacterium]|nr:hypothetical protein [Candidatus Obscuribacterales bacterium]